MTKLSGVPIGGIGTGKIELFEDGFKNITITNNLDNPFCMEKALDGSGLILFNGENNKCTSLIGEFRNCENLGLSSEEAIPPYSDIEYMDFDKCSVSMEVFSPFIKGDLKNSSIPVIAFEVTLHNKYDNDIEAGICLFFKNICGVGGRRFINVEDYNYNTAKQFERNELYGITLSHSNDKVDYSTNGEITIAADTEKAEVSHMIYPEFFFNIDDRRHVIEHLEQEGKLPNNVVCGTPADPKLYSALFAKKIIPAGKTEKIKIFLSWYFPIRYKQDNVEYKNYYTNNFDNSINVIKYTKDNFDYLKNNTLKIKNMLDISTLPKFLVERLKAGIFPMISNSLFISDGRFSITESPVDMGGCMGTMDQRSCSNAFADMFYPELSKSEMMQFKNQQINKNHKERYGKHWDTVNGEFGIELDRLGAIPHDIGWGNLEQGWLGYSNWTTLHWPDIQCGYVLQSILYVLWTGDKDFLNQNAESMMMALDFASRLSQDDSGTPNLWGPGCNTFDSHRFPYFGASSYITSLYVAALAAFIEVSQYIDKPVDIQRFIDRKETAVTFMNNKLWNEEFECFDTWADKNYASWDKTGRKHAAKSESCMSAQIAGEWFAQLMNIKTGIDQDKIVSALKTIHTRNIESRQGCGANESSLKSTDQTNSWPFYIDTYFCANALYHNFADVGLDGAERIYNAFSKSQKLYCAPLEWENAQGMEPGWGRWYMSNTSVWHINHAVSGAKLNMLEGKLSLNLRSNKYMDKYENIPLFYPDFTLQVTLTDDEVIVKIDSKKYTIEDKKEIRKARNKTDEYDYTIKKLT